MINENKSNRKTVLISAAAAAVIFAVLSVLIIFSAQITESAAVRSAQSENYERAMALLEKITEENSDVKKSASYRVACIMQENGEYDMAQALFSSIGEYSDSADRVCECIIGKAEMLMSVGEYSSAAGILSEILFYSPAEQSYKQCQYLYACQQAEQGNWLVAVQLLCSIRDYSDAEEMAKDILFSNTGSDNLDDAITSNGNISPEQFQKIALLEEKRTMITNGYIDVGFGHTVGLSSEGTVFACGDNSCGQCDVGEWKNVTQIAAGANHTVALFKDGTVAACGDNSYGQCDVDEWKNVVQIEAGAYNTFALLEDGSVVSCGYNKYKSISGWKNVDRILADSYSAGCIYNGGYMHSSHSSGATDGIYVDAAVSTAYFIGLKSDGTVVSNAQLPEDWENIVAVYASVNSAAGITADGEVKIHFFRTDDTVLPNDKKAVSAALGGTHSAILYEDGSVYCFGQNEYGQCATEDWLLF